MGRQYGLTALLLLLTGTSIANASETYSFYAIECELEGQKQCGPLAELTVVVNPTNQSVQFNGIVFKTNERFANVLSACRVTDEKNFSCEENIKYSDTAFTNTTFGLADGKYLTYKRISYPAAKTTGYYVGPLEYYWRKWKGNWMP